MKQFFGIRGANKRTTAALFAMLLVIFSVNGVMAADAVISVDLIDQAIGRVGVVGFEVDVPADTNLAAFTLETSIDPTIATLDTFDESSSSFSFVTCNAEGTNLACSGFNTTGFTDERVKLFDLSFTCQETGAVLFGGDEITVNVFTDSSGVPIPYTFDDIAGTINCADSTAATLQGLETIERTSPFVMLLLFALLSSAVVGYKICKNG